MARGSKIAPRLIVGLTLALVLIVSVLLGACAAQPAPVKPTTPTPKPIATKTIVVGSGMPLTGPWASSCVPIFNGSKDYLSYVNDVEGGLTIKDTNYKFDVHWIDTKMDVAQAVSSYKRFAEEGAVIVFNASTAEAGAQIPVTMDVKVPLIGCGIDDNYKNNQSVYSFCIDCPYQISTPIALKWFKDNRFKGTGKMKVARLFVDGAMGQTANLPALNEILEQEIGCELLPVEWFPATITDFTPYLLRIRDSKPDVIFCQMVGDPYSIALKDAVRLGMDITNPQFLSCEWGGMTSTFAGAVGSAGEGSLSMYYYNNLWESLDNSSYPQIQKMLDIAQKYQNTRRPPENYAKGLEFGLITRRMAERAITNTGSVTKESMLAEMNKVSGEDFIMGPKVTWTDCRRYGIAANGVLVLKGGKLQPITPPNLEFTPMTKQKMAYLWQGGCAK